MAYALKYAKEICLTLSSFIFVLFYFPIVYDESYGSFCNNQLIGQFTDKPLMDLYYLAWVGFNEIYKGLHTLIPSINWGGIAFLMFNVLGLLLLLYATKVLLKQLQVANIQILIIQVFFCIIYLDNFMSITHTRFSIFYCGMALILLALKQDLQKKHVLLYSLLFIIGMLHRPESGPGMLFFSAIAMVFIQPKKMFSLTKRWLFPVLSVLVLLGIFTVDWMLTDKFEKKIEPNIEYALTTKRIVGLEEMKTPEDSLKYQMANHGIFIDEEFVSIEFLKAITDVQFAFNASKFLMSIKKVLAYWNYYIYFTVFIILSTIYFLVFTEKRIFLQFLAFNLFGMVLYAYIQYNTDISNRHLSPFLLLQTLLNFYLLYSAKNKRQSLLNIFILILFIPAVLSAQNYAEKYRTIKSEVDCFGEIMNHIEAHYQDRYIVVSLFNYRLLDKLFRFTNETYQGNTYLLYDLSYYSLVPPNQNYLASLCNCNPKNPVAFFAWLAKENGLYISVDKRFELIEKYMQDFQKKDFSFYQDDYDSMLIKPNCIGGSGFGNYYLKQIHFKDL